MDMLKENWSESRERFIKWWAGEGLMVGAWTRGVPTKTGEALEPFEQPRDLEQKWLDPQWRARANEHRLIQEYSGLDILPVADMDLGPGSLALMAGSSLKLQDDSLWFEPTDSDPFETPVVFDSENKWFRIHQEMLRASDALSQGRWFSGIQDLVENLDVLASLRASQELLFDLIERPEEVVAKTHEINQLYFKVYDAFYNEFYADGNGAFFNAFRIWAPGKVAKVQVDISAMISPGTFRECAIPALTEQCDWLDYSMYHLDGSQATVHLDALLEIESLNAVEWTPEPGQPGGGDVKWHDMYRKIKAAGKSVQPIQVKLGEVIPLIDAVGPEGLYIRTFFQTLEEAQQLESDLAQFGY